MDSLNKACKIGRTRQEWSQEDAARLMGCHVATISRIERGRASFSRTRQYLGMLKLSERELLSVLKIGGAQ